MTRKQQNVLTVCSLACRYWIIHIRLTIPTVIVTTEDSGRLPTFTLKTLSEKTLEQFLAQLTNGRPRVVVHYQRVRHFNTTRVLLLHPERPTTPRLGAARARLLLIGRRRWGRSFKDWTVDVSGR